MSIRTTTNVTEDEKAAMLKMRNEEGLSVPAIRKRTGRSHTAIRGALGMDNALSRKPQTVSAVARKQRLERILELRAQDYSYSEIGEVLKMNAATVGYHLTKYAKGRNNGAPVRTNHKRRILPIVLGAETVAQTDERRFAAVIDTLWSHLPLDQKLRAIESLKVS